MNKENVVTAEQNFKKKWEIAQIAQENHHMLKRLQSSESKYNLSKFENDFKKNQGYVKNLCNFPVKDPTIMKFTSDNFLNKNSSNSKFPTLYGTFYRRSNSKENKFNNTISNLKSDYNLSSNNETGSNWNNWKLKNKKPNNKTSTNFYKKKNTMEMLTRMHQDESKQNTNFNTTKNENFRNNSSEKKQENDELDKIAYSRKAYIENLGLVELIFIIDDNKFFITVNPLNKNEYIFTIIFSSQIEIDRLGRIYKNYEQIINDLEYDGISINFKKKIKSKLDYVSLFI